MASSPTKTGKAKAGYIYALSEGGVVKYIGQTKDLKKRYGQHCSLAQNMGKTLRNEWLRELIIGGSTPVISSLERAEDMDAAEIKWIKKLRDEGSELLNMADGGQTMTHLQRAKAWQPWGKGWSPTQRILIMLKSDIKMMERLGDQDSADRIRKKYDRCVMDIEKVGSDVMNYLLWEREQERKHAR